MALARLITTVIDCFYWKPFRPLLPLQTFRYAACGGLNMVLDAVWYFVIYHYIVAERFFDLGVVVLSPHIASMLVVFPITFFNGFWLNRNVAFKSSPLSGQTQLFRYALSIVGSILLTYAGLKLFVEVCGFWPTPSKVLTTILTVIYSFLAAKYFT
ncbi:MAG: GtrA family protein, partial [Alistipes sp.]|nr:GtrA family protein [Alistipes sp.]